jgi:hypothetical protein
MGGAKKKRGASNKNLRSSNFQAKIAAYTKQTNKTISLFFDSTSLFSLPRLCLIIVRERLPRYSINTMEEDRSAYSAFNASAATAGTIIIDFCKLPEVPAPPRIDVQRIAYLEKLADELEKGLTDAQQVLEAEPLPSTLKTLEARLSTLQVQYTDCWQRWCEEGGKELTPPRLWKRLAHLNKALEQLYQNVCVRLEDLLDTEDFRAAKEEWEREGRQTTPLDEVVKELGIKA